ncbi:MAG: hypothetical protein KBS84_01005 [Treponema sp.]|nr:hypothetical protein [Candidatus Treponema scatequi]
MADEARMSSVTMNVIGNAMKYTPEGGTVEFYYKEIDCDKPGYAQYVCTVKDTGIGMSKEFLAKLYELFSREKSTTVSKIQGTGLGLSIVKSIIDLMGGKIEVESELGKGTRFDITIQLEIEYADDGDVAVSMVERYYESGIYNYYDFILMDVQMPRMNG